MSQTIKNEELREHLAKAMNAAWNETGGFIESGCYAWENLLGEDCEAMAFFAESIVSALASSYGMDTDALLALLEQHKGEQV